MGSGEEEAGGDEFCRVSHTGSWQASGCDLREFNQRSPALCLQLARRRCRGGISPGMTALVGGQMGESSHAISFQPLC